MAGQYGSPFDGRGVPTSARKSPIETIDWTLRNVKSTIIPSTSIKKFILEEEVSRSETQLACGHWCASNSIKRALPLIQLSVRGREGCWGHSKSKQTPFEGSLFECAFSNFKSSEKLLGNFSRPEETYTVFQSSENVWGALDLQTFAISAAWLEWSVWLNNHSILLPPTIISGSFGMKSVELQ